MATPTGERTEQPTSRRRKEARERGQVARSKVLGEAASLAAVLVVLAQIGPAFVERAAGLLRMGLIRTGVNPTLPVQPTDLAATSLAGGRDLALLVGPIALASAAAAVIVQGLQGGWNFATGAVRLD